MTWPAPFLKSDAVLRGVSRVGALNDRSKFCGFDAAHDGMVQNEQQWRRQENLDEMMQQPRLLLINSACLGRKNSVQKHFLHQGTRSRLPTLLARGSLADVGGPGAAAGAIAAVIRRAHFNFCRPSFFFFFVRLTPRLWYAHFSRAARLLSTCVPILRVANIWHHK